ncbi:hypothetical protein [Flavobacterium sp. UBA4197]|uniref:hypothetical protein n=1 Tax=Flavobacterium sp. UBA4197 TaxID=1946546 RepID=UPI00257AD783|nr:hypothetical protein [Flavobacterium sp. UBA4197]
MKKALNSNNILQIIIALLLFYCVLSIMRSFGLLFLAYTDDYFYNFDFEKSQYPQKSIVFNNAYYFFTYLAGLLFSFILNRVLKLDLLVFILSLVFGFVLFRFIDSDIIRPFFDLFDNPRMNIGLHLLTFLIIGTVFYLILNKKLKMNLDS